MTAKPETTSASSTIHLFGALLLAVLAIGFFVVLLQTAAATPGEFTVSDLNPGNTTVNENDTVTVSATIQNTGEATETQIVTLSLGEHEKRVSVTLEPGQTEKVELQQSRAGTLGLGNTSSSVRTDDDRSTAMLTVDSERPPVFEVTSLSPGNFSIGGDRWANVSAVIENTGGTAANQTVELWLDGRPFVEEWVELEPGEAETFDVFNVGFGGLPAGERTYGVYTTSDRATATVTVPEPATLELRDLAPGDTTVHRNDRVDISATVENTGEIAANRTVTLSVDDEPFLTKRLELAAGERTTLEFADIDADEIGVGMHRYSLSTGDQVRRGTLIVESDEPATFEITAFEPGNTEVEAEGFFNISATIENTGGKTANQTVELRINNDVRTTIPVELPPGESDEIRVFNIYVGALDVGIHRYSLATDADTETAILTIEY